LFEYIAYIGELVSLKALGFCIMAYLVASWK